MIFHIETLGCSRNQVDSEIMLTKLQNAGHVPADEPARAQAIVVNTCTFITTASDEAVETILEMAAYKQSGACERLIVTGCLAQRYKNDPDLTTTLPEVDAFLGTAACEQIVDAVESRETQTLTLFPAPGTRGFQDPSEKRAVTTGPYAFIKVSEGCDRHCTFCIIPTLRGRQRSRPVAEIISEACHLSRQGAEEIVLTAENTTDYGKDLSQSFGFDQVIAQLSDALASAAGDAAPPWLRFLYAHPATLNRQVVETVSARPSVCSYYDVPIQHASSRMLKKMGRPYTREDLVAVFDMIRQVDPDATLRTTLIVGFPGETETDFQELLDFIKKIRFDHLGVFTYSDAEDLPAHHLEDDVDPQVAESHQDMIMAAQADISKSVNERHLGRVYEVLVEENPEPGVYIGRTQFQAPEVDGVTFIYSDGLEINTRVRVKITDAYEYDIAGELE